MNHSISIKESKVMSFFLFASSYGFSTIKNTSKMFISLNFQYFGKNETLKCRLVITILQPLGLAFFNYMIKFLTIEYHESFSTSFYLLFFPICCTIPNDVNFFEHILILFRKLNSKKHHHFRHFFFEK